MDLLNFIKNNCICFVYVDLPNAHLCTIMLQEAKRLRELGNELHKDMKYLEAIKSYGEALSERFCAVVYFIQLVIMATFVSLFY